VQKMSVQPERIADACGASLEDHCSPGQPPDADSCFLLDPSRRLERLLMQDHFQVLPLYHLEAWRLAEVCNQHICKTLAQPGEFPEMSAVFEVEHRNHQWFRKRCRVGPRSHDAGRLGHR